MKTIDKLKEKTIDKLKDNQVIRKIIDKLNIQNIKNNPKTSFMFIIIIIILILIGVLVSFLVKTFNLNNINCTNMRNIYKKNTNIGNINVNSDSYKHTLKDYYVKSAYNACSANLRNKNDYVNECALITCIEQGYRMLDFEIYSVDNKPVVSTSSVDNYKTKGTYNSIPFSQVIDIINTHAFSSGKCPNPNDPLIIHLRIKSKNKKIYSEMTNILYNTLGNRLLGPKYSYEYNGNNLGNVKLKDLLGKVVLSINRENSLFEETTLNEYVNIASFSTNFNCLTYDEILYHNNIDDFKIFNKRAMTICIPNLSVNVENKSSMLPISYGCQFVAMCAQKNDDYLKEYNKFFNDIGSAFKLKPDKLRMNFNIVNNPTPASQTVSYASRSINSEFYDYKI